MGILDDAIKEHLDLKRQHGADESELKQLEDEAFGAAERPGDEPPPPDALSEAPTEFMTQPDLPAGEDAPAEAEAAEEAPEAEAPPAADTTDAGRPQPRAEIADLQEPPAPPEPAADAPPVAPTGPATEEREAIAEQPTEMFNVEEELAASASPAPTEEELVEEGMEEPRLAPVDPLAGLDEGGEVEVVQPADEDDEDEVDDEFWNEQRLSDELDQALEAPLDDDDVLFEDDDEAPEGEHEPEARPHVRHDDDEDVLEETPNFLEEDSEDDQLWFEQKPPKDFDFDD